MIPAGFSDKPRLSDREVHVWHISCAKLEHLVPTLWTLLDSVEQSRAGKYARQEDRARFVITRGALRCLLEQYLGIAGKEVSITASPMGKPSVNSESRLEFNVSHSHEWALIGFATSRLGIDVECVKPLHAASLAKRFFSPAECDALMNVASDKILSTFYRCWTRKEAYIKADGQGLSRSLASFSVSVNESDPKLLWSELGQSEVEQWKFFNLAVPPQYSGSVVVHSEVETVVERVWSLPWTRARPFWHWSDSA